MDIFISVIIPVYGVEKYIERCARSLFGQTMTEGVEFIFVDDCTPDHSIEILNDVLAEYPGRQSQTHIIHHPENRGLPTARRTGIDSACGQYIVHCDSDDWMDQNALQILSKNVVAENLDMVIYNNYVVRENKIYSTFPADKNIEIRTLLSDVLSHKFRYTVWCKMVRREIYQRADFVYPILNQGEDFVFSAQLGYYSKSVEYIPDPLYFYAYNPDSLVNNKTEEWCLSRKDGFGKNIDVVVEFLKSHDLYDKYGACLLIPKLECRNHLLPYIEKYYDLWRSTYPELDTWESFWKFPLKLKIKYLLIRLHFYKVYSILQKISHIIR